jgi:hypothetical protein
MPSDRRQWNVRVSEETGQLADRLMVEVSKRVGVELHQSQLLALALQSLAREHGVPAVPDVPPAPKRGRKPKPTTG